MWQANSFQRTGFRDVGACSAQCSFAPGCQGLRTGQPVSPRAPQALGQLEETGLGVRTLDFFFPSSATNL